MSDKPKTIQEALAEVQRNVEKNNLSELDYQGFKAGNPERKKQYGKSASEVGSGLSTLGSGLKKTITGTNDGESSASSDILRGGAETLKGLGRAAFTTVKGAGDLAYRGGLPPAPASSTTTTTGAPAGTAAPATTSAAGGSTGPGKSNEKPATTSTAPEAPKPPAPTGKPEEPKQTFGQAFSAARKAAGGAGGKFTYGDKEFQTNIKGEKYQPVSQLKNVNPKGPEAPSDTKTTVDAPLPPERPTNFSVTTKPDSEGTKKVKTEETNPLITAFLKLQEKETSNIFVEAKKLAKKDHDGDGKIESEKDEVWGSRFRAAKAAGKLKEEEQVDEDLATAMTLGGLAGTAAAPFVAKGVNKAMDYLEKKRMKKYSDERKAKKSVKKEEVESSKMPKDWGEEVSFSESELAYFASIDEVGTPTSPTARKTSANDVRGDTVDKRDLTDGVVEEGRKKKEVASTEPTERDARQHVQVIAGQAAGGREIDFKHNNGKSTKIGPEMGRKITAHLNGLKPAERQAKVKAMHDSPEGMKF